MSTTVNGLETYLEGHYSALKSRGTSLEIPASEHIALSACERTQKAWGGKDRSGVFTSALLEALEQNGDGISYANLFVRCRAAVRKRADNQNPQFETYRGFNAYGAFLGGSTSQGSCRYSVYFECNGWRMDCGAVHGSTGQAWQRVGIAWKKVQDPVPLAVGRYRVELIPSRHDGYRTFRLNQLTGQTWYIKDLKWAAYEPLEK